MFDWAHEQPVHWSGSWYIDVNNASAGTPLMPVGDVSIARQTGQASFAGHGSTIEDMTTGYDDHLLLTGDPDTGTLSYTLQGFDQGSIAYTTTGSLVALDTAHTYFRSNSFVLGGDDFTEFTVSLVHPTYDPFRIDNIYIPWLSGLIFFLFIDVLFFRILKTGIRPIARAGVDAFNQ